MATNINDYMNILLAIDGADPIHWDTPPGFDPFAEEEKFITFRDRLCEAIGGPCLILTNEQDSTRFGYIVLPENIVIASCSDPRKALNLSNWGGLMTIGPAPEEIRPEILAVVMNLIEEFSYIYIPEPMLLLPYTGKNPYRATSRHLRTWRTRYFGML